MNEQRIALRQRRDLGEIIQAALHLYQRNFAALFVIAAVVVPLGIASAALQRAVDDSVGVGFAILGIAILQLAVNLLAGAAIIIALTKIDQGGDPTFADTYDAAFERFGTLLGAFLRALVIVLLLSITIVGLPWAIQRMVRWIFIEQAVILDGATPSTALSRSAAAVQGRWWRTLGIAIVIGLISTLPASIVAAVLIVAPVLVSGTVNSFVNALLLPFAVTAMTLLYFDLQVRKESDERIASDPAP
ncbi:MAG: hypothetical protein J4N95_07365 [Chloroflexi bacterium]|nr:hypothetical protein [Chloroflexota bacterium]